VIIESLDGPDEASGRASAVMANRPKTEARATVAKVLRIDVSHSRKSPTAALDTTAWI
jgi:hypothetical protein